MKKDAKEMRDFFSIYGRGVKVSGVGQIYKWRPRSLPLLQKVKNLCYTTR